MYNDCMLDKSLEYVEILMKRKRGRPVRAYPLPEGYKFVSYMPDDEFEWAEIEFSVNEFESTEKALGYFLEKYFQYSRELERRCLFIEDSRGMKVATFTAWWEYVGSKRVPWVSWIAVKPEYQGMGLGKALVSAGMKLMIDIEGDVDIYLKTQTWSYKAINIYREQGFRMLRKINDESCKKLYVGKAKKILKGKLK